MIFKTEDHTADFIKSDLKWGSEIILPVFCKNLPIFSNYNIYHVCSILINLLSFMVYKNRLWNWNTQILNAWAWYANSHNWSFSASVTDTKYCFGGTKVLIIDIISAAVRKIHMTLGRWFWLTYVIQMWLRYYRMYGFKQIKNSSDVMHNSSS